MRSLTIRSWADTIDTAAASAAALIQREETGILMGVWQARSLDYSVNTNECISMRNHLIFTDEDVHSMRRQAFSLQQRIKGVCRGNFPRVDKVQRVCQRPGANLPPVRTGMDAGANGLVLPV